MTVLESRVTRQYSPDRSSFEVARDYLNSRFPFDKAKTGLEVFERIARIIELEADAGRDFALFVTEGTIPEYIERWAELAQEDFLHRPINER